MAVQSQNDSKDRKVNNWLCRQIGRVRHILKHNVVIAQVGNDARNVVIGTNNIQINVGNHNLALPILFVPLLLLVIIGFLVYPALEPIWHPAQMTKEFRIAVADFGEMDSKGRVQATKDGRVLSKWLVDNLFEEYQQNADVEMADVIEIWHDSRMDVTPQNFRLGIINGNTAEARRASAAKLADRIGAHMVIFGNLVTDGSASGLDLEFYLSPLVDDETTSITGPHRLGKPVPLPVPFNTGQPQANVVVKEKLKVRTDALFWLTIGLTQQLLGRSEKALETFWRAEEELEGWPESDGKELLYFFIGREELFLEQSENAQVSFRKALQIDPTYARAQVALGSTYLQRARAVQPQARLKETKYLEQALDHHRRGLELALTAQDPLVEAIARIALSKSYRLLGETHYFLDAYDEANRLFDLVISEVEQVIPLLADARQYRLLAQAYEVQGAAYLQQGDILRRQQEIVESRARFELAQTAYQSCIEQGDNAFFDEILQKKVIEQGCRRYKKVTTEYLGKLEGEQR